MATLWVVVIPQIVLVLLNIRGWTLISGEASEQELFLASAILVFEIAIILLGLFVFWQFKSGRLQLDWKLCLGSLILHCTYMWTFIACVDYIIPNSIQPWILNEENIGRWNITLFMPGAFISLYALTKTIGTGVSTAKGSLAILLTAIGMPVAWYLFVATMQPAWLGQYSVIYDILIATVIVVSFLGAIIWILERIIRQPIAGNLQNKHYIIAVILGLAGPLGGLTLNDEIPFPVDFQSFGVYALTIVNGMVLLLKTGEQKFSSIRLFLRCALFPFIAYFFFVFLPFLPLSIIAILFIGTGFLMLTPLVLGLFQTRLTLEEFSTVSVVHGKFKASIIGLLGLLVLPSYFLTQAIIEKQSLTSTLEYFYSHDISAELPSETNVSRSANALIQLRDRKAGIQLPYISEAYNSIVFGQLVLSDSKISRMYTLLTGSAMPAAKIPVFAASGRALISWNLVAPKTNIDLEKAEITQSDNNSATLKLALKNMSNDTHSLYIGHLQIPEGVFISGLRLKIEQDWVDGRVFDQKTALWVFQKITEIKRDPALLYYRSPNELELRVYPFPKQGIREVEIDFNFHEKIDSNIVIDDKKIDLNPSFGEASIILESGQPLIDQSLANYGLERKPYLHFILDYSKKAQITNNEYLEIIQKVSQQLGIKKIRVSAANIGVSDKKYTKLIDLEDSVALADRLENIALRKVGGLWVEQAIAKEILRIRDSINEENFHWTPKFVVIRDQHTSKSQAVSLDPWSWLVPDMQGWYSYANGKLEHHIIQQNLNVVDASALSSNQVVIAKIDSKISVFPTDTSSILQSKNKSKIAIFNPTQNTFLPSLNLHTDETNEKWNRYAEIWVDWKAANLSRSDIEIARSDLLQSSRKDSILLPTTSFIVVENPSQWEILQRKETQSLSHHSGLDFEEQQQTSEPPWWILLAGLIIFLYYRTNSNRNY